MCHCCVSDESINDGAIKKLGNYNARGVDAALRYNPMPLLKTIYVLEHITQGLQKSANYTGKILYKRPKHVYYNQVQIYIPKHILSAKIKDLKIY